MNRKLAHLLTRLYPRRWRERYGAEFAAFLQDCESGLRATANVVGSAIRERIFPTMEGKMPQDFRSFRVWCVRAPWAIFLLMPVFFLSMAYLVACLYLWSGWQIFLPRADTPFGQGVGPIYGEANIYFQVGKFYYFGSPILVGWATVFVAARQRVQSAWLVIGWILIAWLGSAAQVHASRTTVPTGFGHVSMEFPLGSSLHGIYHNPFHALAIFSLTALPYLICRFSANTPRPQGIV